MRVFQKMFEACRETILVLRFQIYHFCTCHIVSVSLSRLSHSKVLSDKKVQFKYQLSSYSANVISYLNLINDKCYQNTTKKHILSQFPVSLLHMQWKLFFAVHRFQTGSIRPVFGKELRLQPSEISMALMHCDGKIRRN